MSRVLAPRRRARAGAAIVAAIGLLALASACGDRSGALRGTGEGDPGRARVLRFWDAMRRGSDARRAADFDAAIARYSEALEIDPRHEDALYYLGHCQYEAGRQSEARAAFDRLLAVNPASARGQAALGAILAAPKGDAAPDLPEAERHFRLAHDINKEETGPMVRLGEIRLVQRDPQGAGFWLRSALTTNPKSLEAAFLVGYLQWRAGEGVARATATLEAATAVPAVAPAARVVGEGDRIPQGTSPSGPSTPAAPAPPVIAPPVEQPHGATLFGDLALRARGAAGAGAVPRDPEDLERLFREVATRTDAIRARAQGGSSTGAGAIDAAGPRR